MHSTPGGPGHTNLVTSPTVSRRVIISAPSNLLESQIFQGEIPQSDSGDDAPLAQLRERASIIKTRRRHRKRALEVEQETEESHTDGESASSESYDSQNEPRRSITPEPKATHKRKKRKGVKAAKKPSMADDTAETTEAEVHTVVCHQCGAPNSINLPVQAPTASSLTSRAIPELYMHIKTLLENQKAIISLIKKHNIGGSTIGYAPQAQLPAVMGKPPMPSQSQQHITSGGSVPYDAD